MEKRLAIQVASLLEDARKRQLTDQQFMAELIVRAERKDDVAITTLHLRRLGDQQKLVKGHLEVKAALRIVQQPDADRQEQEDVNRAYSEWTANRGKRKFSPSKLAVRVLKNNRR